MLLFVARSLNAITQSPHPIDGVELRFDQMDCEDEVKIQQLLSSVSVLFTARAPSQIEKLLKLHPPYFDLAHDTSPEFLESVVKRYPKTRFFLSHHNFEHMPDLESTLQNMLSPWAFGYKIACKASSSIDALRMSAFVQEKTKAGVRLSGIAMGEQGSFARVFGPIVGNFFDYTSSPPFLGQLSLEELHEIYHYGKLNPQTEIFALIGDPVHKSMGHQVHNRAFLAEKRNAVYVKIPIKKEELADFFKLARALPFRGLSITMPHKQEVLACLDAISEEAQAIGAVNTVLVKEGKFWGYNTDGEGALVALEKMTPIPGKHLVLLGAGGTARAIAYAAQKLGALVTVLNRTEKPGFTHGPLEKLEHLDYDILIHATSIGMLDENIPIDPRWIRPQKAVMDVVLGETPLLVEAKKKGCLVVTGESLFLEQAKLQRKIWFAEIDALTMV